MNNPLSQYFRQPSIYIKLPSKGQFYPIGALNMPANNELPVLPMTAIDEIAYRTPDGLYNGSSTVNVIQSCCPNITNAWAMPTIDADAILIAIRIATSGSEMPIDSKCPHCENESRHSIDLNRYLIGIKTPNYNKTLIVDDLVFKFKPSCPVLLYPQVNSDPPTLKATL